MSRGRRTPPRGQEEERQPGHVRDRGHAGNQDECGSGLHRSVPPRRAAAVRASTGPVPVGRYSIPMMVPTPAVSMTAAPIRSRTDDARKAMKIAGVAKSNPYERSSGSELPINAPTMDEGTQEPKLTRKLPTR